MMESLPPDELVKPTRVNDGVQRIKFKRYIHNIPRIPMQHLKIFKTFSG